MSTETKVEDVQATLTTEWEALSPAKAAKVMAALFPGVTFPRAADPDVRRAMRAMITSFSADPLRTAMYYVWVNSPEVKSKHGSIVKRSEHADRLTHQARLDYLKHALETIRKAARI